MSERIHSPESIIEREPNPEEIGALIVLGKNKGMFVLPMLIGIIKYNWFMKTGLETIMVWSQSWKMNMKWRLSGARFTCAPRAVAC